MDYETIKITFLYDFLDEINNLYYSKFIQKGENNYSKFYTLKIRIIDGVTKDYLLKLCSMSMRDFIDNVKFDKKIKVDALALYYTKKINLNMFKEILRMSDFIFPDNCLIGASSYASQDIHGVVLEENVKIPREFYAFDLNEDASAFIQNLVVKLHNKKTCSMKKTNTEKKCILC